MTVSLLFACVDAAVGVYLLWYARARERRRREPVAIVGMILLFVAACLCVVEWKAAHPTLHRVPVWS